MTRKVPPPDFRYVWLLPGPASAALTLAAGVVGMGLFGVALWSSGHQTTSLGLALAGGALAALLFVRSEGRIQPRHGAREVAMAIVPWGVVVTPDTEPRVLRWSAVRKITVDVSHSLRGGTPAILSSLVTVQTEREVLAGRTSGSVGLERLTANLDDYAEEAGRPVACNLDGVEPAEDGVTEPVVATLLRNAEMLCSTGQGAARLSLPAGDYRTVASRRAAPETLSQLRSILGAGVDTPADPRPLAAVVAGLLDARDLVPDLIRLSSSPHPVMAALARAAAIRLGAPRNRPGAIDEVAAFLFEEDFELIRKWAEGPGAPAGDATRTEPA